jgi:hypothetical protein
MDEFAAMARAALREAGVAVDEDDLPLVVLVYQSMVRQFAALDAADPVRFPFEPVDPSRAP